MGLGIGRRLHETARGSCNRKISEISLSPISGAYEMPILQNCLSPQNLENPGWSHEISSFLYPPHEKKTLPFLYALIDRLSSLLAPIPALAAPRLIIARSASAPFFGPCDDAYTVSNEARGPYCPCALSRLFDNVAPSCICQQ